MKKQLLSLLTILTLSAEAFTSHPSDLEPKAGQPITFLENKGQISDQNNEPRPDILFSGNTADMTFYLRNTGLSYQFSRIDTWKEIEDLKFRKKIKVPDLSTIYRLDLDWLNCNTNLLVKTDEVLAGYDNYYLAACPNGIKNVKTFTGVTYKDLYDRIDLHFYEKNGSLKYDYIVSAGADYKQIQLSVKGAEKISLSSKGELVIITPFGTINEAAPLVMQDGKKLRSTWVIKNSVVSFEIQNLQPDMAFIIDPLIRAWGTYYGAAYSEGRTITTDASNNIYSTGHCDPSSLIATTGSHQTIFAGSLDAFIVKFNSAGLRQWGTYFGGSNFDTVSGCTTDASGNIYVTGMTASSSGISTPGSHQPVLASVGQVSSNAFLVKFDGTGSRLWGTYYGDTGPDWGTDCATDANGNVYMTGSATSNVSISTPGSHQPTRTVVSIFDDDAFLVKFNSAGVRQWGTYFGGTPQDIAMSCATDPFGNIYIAGITESNTGIATPGSLYPTLLGGWDGDGFLAKFDAQGVQQWGTYYGTSAPTGSDHVADCATDQAGNVYITGVVASGSGGSVTPIPGTTNFIATPGCHQPNPSGSQLDIYLAKFDPSGARQWGTYYGSGGMSNSCATDLSGNVYIVGDAGFLPISGFDTPGAFQTVFGGNGDAFMAKFNSAGVRQYGTLYGGTGWERGYACTVSSSGEIYMTGATSSSSGTVIATPGSHQPFYAPAPTNAGSAFIVKFADCDYVISSVVAQLDLLCHGNTNGSVSITASSGASSLTYSWAPTGGTSTSLSGLSGGTYSCIITNTCGVATVQTVTINEPETIALLISPSNSIFCSGDNSILTVNESGGTAPFNYVWSGGATGTGNSITVSPAATTIYSVSGTDANGCSGIATITQSVSNCLSIGDITEKIFFSVYPNPAQDQITIQFNKKQEGCSIELFNAIGQLILKEESEGEFTALDLSKQSKGLYYIKLQNKESKAFIKVLHE